MDEELLHHIVILMRLLIHGGLVLWPWPLFSLPLQLCSPVFQVRVNQAGESLTCWRGLSPDNNSYCLWNGGDRPDEWKWNNMENSSRLTGVHCDFYFDGLVQDCSNSSALAVELLQSCTKPSNCFCFCIWVLIKTSSWLCNKGIMMTIKIP